MKIGNTLKEIRKSKRMTLSALSKKSGVQIATLSRIEHNKMTGTIGSHLKIAEALQIDLSLLYSQSSKADVDKKDEKQSRKLKTIKYNDKASYEILASELSLKKMMPVLLKIEKNGSSNKEQHPFGSERFIFVLDGCVELKITRNMAGKENIEAYMLNKNNSLYFDASFLHVITNKGKSTAKVLSTISPVAL